MSDKYPDGRKAAIQLIAREADREAKLEKRIIAIGATGPGLPSLKRPVNIFFDELDVDATLESFLMGRRVVSGVIAPPPDTCTYGSHPLSSCPCN